MPNLYLLAKEYVELENALIASADDETGEVDIDIAGTLEKVHGTFEEKAVAVATVYRDLKKYENNIGEEIKRLQALKKRVGHEKQRIDDYLTQACEMTGTKLISGIYANISFRKSEQTIIDDEALLPKEYLTEKVSYEPNKTKIKEAIKRGVEVQGAHIEVKNNLQIK